MRERFGKHLQVSASKGFFTQDSLHSPNDEAEEKAFLISQYVDHDETCRETLRLFLEPYAKCPRNFALDTLALGGIYLAGGILAKNLPHIDSEAFRQHFEENDRHPEILRTIPIRVISNYDVTLLGATFAATLPE